MAWCASTDGGVRPSALTTTLRSGAEGITAPAHAASSRAPCLANFPRCPHQQQEDADEQYRSPRHPVQDRTVDRGHGWRPRIEQDGNHIVHAPGRSGAEPVLELDASSIDRELHDG